MSENKKVAIITGSTKGIGQGIATALAAKNIITVVTGRKRRDAEQAAKQINSGGGIAWGLEFNLENPDHLENLIQQTTEQFGRLDILINNAITQSAAMPLNAVSDQEINAIFTANISHILQLCRYAYPHLQKSRGHIINIGSVIVNRHLLGLSMYAMIKGAILQMTKALASEWAGDGIRVNAINPGITRTSVFESLGLPENYIKNAFQFYSQYHALEHIAKPADIGNLAGFLCSSESRLITGSIFEVDGGYSIKGLPTYQE